jgi:hypothetical protein
MASWNKISEDLESGAAKQSQLEAAMESEAKVIVRAQQYGKRLENAAHETCDKMTLQVDTLKRALQYARTLHEQTAASHAATVKRIHEINFPGGAQKDARPLLRQLQEADAAREKEHI